jgi:hypothetical protein
MVRPGRRKSREGLLDAGRLSLNSSHECLSKVIKGCSGGERAFKLNEFSLVEFEV